MVVRFAGFGTLLEDFKAVFQILANFHLHNYGR